MEPVTTAVVAAFTIDKTKEMAFDFAKDWLKRNVFAGEAEYRLQQFVYLLLREANLTFDEKPTSAEVDEALKGILNTDARKNAVLEAYRRVCLSASKELGPRIIALITGRRLGLGGFASSLEEQYSLCAEQLSDMALIKFAVSMREAMKRQSDIIELKLSLHPNSIIEIDLFKIDTAASGALSDIPGIRDAALIMGTWVHRMKSLGVLSDELKQTSIDGGNAAMDGADSSEYIYRLFCTTEFVGLVELIEKAQGPN